MIHKIFLRTTVVTLLAIFWTLPFDLQAVIIKTNQIEEVLNHIHEDCWVFFDVDDTILTSEVQLGRSDYYLVDFAMIKQQGLDDETTHEICQQRWNEMQEKCRPRLMEDTVYTVIQEAQNKAAYTLGLTARGPQTASITHKQLMSLGINFSISSPSALMVDLPLRQVYEHGIWYVEFNGKGSSVRKWLNESEHHPAKIIFIDDRHYHLKNMENALSDLDIEFVGIHYCKVQENPFNEQIAIIQASFFPHILSDEEAAILLQKY